MSQLVNCCCEKCVVPPPADEYVNVTRVHDYTVNADPAGIAPYSRAIDGGCYSGLWHYIPGENNHPALSNQGFDGAPLQDNTALTGIKTCAGGGGQMVQEILDNCYQRTGNQIQFPVTPPRCVSGWKAVASMANWMGRLGFQDASDCCPEAAPTQTRYKSFTASISYDHHLVSTEPLNPLRPTSFMRNAFDFNQTAAVDDAGNLSRTGTASVRESYGQIVDGQEIPDHSTNHTCMDHPTDAHGNWWGRGPLETALSLTSACGQVRWRPYLGEWSYGTPEQVTQQLLDYIIHAFGGFVPDDPRYSISDQQTEGIYTNTRVRLRASAKITFVPMPGQPDPGLAVRNVSLSADLQLGSPSHFADVMAEAITLLGEFPLNDDRIHPWRTDDQMWLMPLVRRDAGWAEPVIDWQMVDCEFISIGGFSGDILGAPLPAGFGRHYDYQHVNMQRSLGGDGTTCHGCEHSLGAMSAEPLPRSVTHWTTRGLGSSLWPGGGHVAQAIEANYSQNSPGHTPINGVIMVKWAETREEWPGMNYARPCGFDRWRRIEADDACIESFDGQTGALTLNPYALTEFAVGNRIGLPGGVWTVTGKTSAHHYTLSPVSGLPAGVIYDGAKRMRFWSARSICGELAVTSATQTGAHVVLSVGTRHWLADGDTVTITGVPGLSGNYTVTVDDDDTFRVTGALSGSYTSGGKVAQGGPVEWDTSCGRGNYLLSTWESRRRQAHNDPEEPPYIQNIAQHTAPKTTAQPFVLVASPNAGDTWPAMHKVSWDADRISADQCFGEDWHAVFTQAVPDPYWQPPRPPCGYDVDECGGWRMAGSYCAPLACGEFARPPLLEPVMVPPTGAPPVGVPWHNFSGGPPPAIGVDFCVSVPRSTANVHSLYAGWLACEDWKPAIAFTTMGRCAAVAVTAADETVTAADETVTAASG